VTIVRLLAVTGRVAQEITPNMGAQHLPATQLQSSKIKMQIY